MRPESEGDRADQQGIRNQIVPAYRLAKDEKYKHREHDESDALLHDLELRYGEVVRANPVCWDLKDILKQRDAPTQKYCRQEGKLFEFQVPVPGDGHKGVGDY